MRLEDLNWMDVERYLKSDDRLMLVLGACEQHGYLSLLTDVKIPLALATAAAQRANVLVAPPLNFGISPYFARYPGTLSLRTETFLAVVGDLVRWAHQQGSGGCSWLMGTAAMIPSAACWPSWSTSCRP